MSDGMTDIYRDTERAHNFLRYLDALASLLEDPSLQNDQELFEIALRTDGVR